MNGYIVNRKNVFFIVISFFLFFLILLMLLQHDVPRIIRILLLVVTFLPIVSIPVIKKIHTKRIFIEPDTGNNVISIAVEKMNGQSRTPIIINLDSVKNYQIFFPNRRFTDIKFKLESNKKIDLSFDTTRNKTEKIDVNAIIDSLRNTIINYNKSNADGREIILKPSFYASAGGLISVVGLGVLIVIAITLHIIYSVKTLPISLFISIALFLQVVSRRKNDLKYYKTMKQ